VSKSTTQQNRLVNLKKKATSNQLVKNCGGGDELRIVLAEGGTCCLIRSLPPPPFSSSLAHTQHIPFCQAAQRRCRRVLASQPPKNLQLLIYCAWRCIIRWASRGAVLAAWLVLYGHSPPSEPAAPFLRAQLSSAAHRCHCRAPLPPSLPTTITSRCVEGALHAA